jgi:hypothetical protein
VILLVSSGKMHTYRVVKFIVNVRVVENSVKSHVGRVIVVNVMDQYKILGIALNMKRIRRLRPPRTEVDEDVLRDSLAGDVGIFRLSVSDNVSRFSTTDDTDCNTDMAVANRLGLFPPSSFDHQACDRSAS